MPLLPPISQRVSQGSVPPQVGTLTSAPPPDKLSRLPEPVQEQYRPGGCVFSAAGDRATVSATALNQDATLDGTWTGMWFGVHPSVMGANQYIRQKSSGLTTRGASVLFDSLSGGAGRIRLIVGVSAGNYIDVFSAIPAVSVASTHEAIAVSLSGTAVTMYRNVPWKPLVEAAPYTDNNPVARGTPATDAGDVLTVGANTGGANPHGNTTSMWVEYKRVLTADERLTVQAGYLAMIAGDFTLGLARLRSVPSCLALVYCGNDGIVTDYTGNGEAALVARSAAGATIENDAAGTRLNQLFSLSEWESDIEGKELTGDQGLYRHVNGYSSRRFTTTAIEASVFGQQTWLDTANGRDKLHAIGFEEGTTYVGTVFGGRTTNGPFGGTVTGLTAGSKTVRLINAPRSRRAAAPSEPDPQEGTWASLVYWSATATAEPIPVPVNAIVVVTDSILEGVTADPPAQHAALQQYRREMTEYDAIIHAGFGGMMLAPITATAAEQTSFIRKYLAINPLRVIIGLHANDKINNTITAATLQTRLASFVDEMLAFPGWRSDGKIVLQVVHTTTAIEGPNSFGDTLGAYRTSVRNVQSTRTARVILLDLEPVVSAANLNADGVHVNNAGQLQILGALRTALSTSQSGSTVETLAGAESQSATADVTATQAEIGIAAETLSATVVAAVTASDTLAAAETPTASTTHGPAAASDTLTAAESQSAAALVAGATPETLAATESPTAVATFPAVQAESVSASDSPAAMLVTAAASSDTLTAADTQTVSGLFAGTVPEALTASDSTDASIAGGPVTHSGSVAESVAASEALEATAVLVAARSEALAVVESSDATIPGVGASTLVATFRGRTPAVTLASRSPAALIAQRPPEASFDSRELVATFVSRTPAVLIASRSPAVIATSRAPTVVIRPPPFT